MKLTYWKKGVKDGIPIGLGYLTVSFTFGMMAVTLGLSVWEAALISLTNLTSAGQFAGLTLIAAHASYLELITSQLIINLRYCLMSFSLSQKLEKGMPAIHRFLVAFGITDEIFGVTSSQPGRVSPYYTYGVLSVAVPGWTFGTILGAVSGSLLPPALVSALSIAIYAMFLAIIIPPAKKNTAVLGVILGAAALSSIFRLLPPLRRISGGFAIIIITILSAGIAAWLRPIEEV